MTTDNRTNEPTEAQVEAAAKAIADCHNPGMFEKYPENWRVEARAALVAAQGAATGGDYHEGLEEGIKIGRAERDAALAREAKVRASAEMIRDAVDRWEVDGDDERLVNDVIDPWLKRVLDADGKEAPDE